MTRTRSKRLPTVLTSEEAQNLLQTVSTRSTTGLRNRCMLQVMLGAGLRVSEVCNLRGRDVDLQRGEVRVNDGKGGRDRVVPVGHETLQWLQQWANKRQDLGLNGKDPFFVGLRTGRTGRGTREEGQGLTTRYVELLVARLAEAAGIDKRTSPHTLRHTYATQLLSEGYNIREVQELLGHSSVSTTEVYTHVNPEALRAKIQAAPPADPEDNRTLTLAGPPRPYDRRCAPLPRVQLNPWQIVRRRRRIGAVGERGGGCGPNPSTRPSVRGG